MVLSIVFLLAAVSSVAGILSEHFWLHDLFTPLAIICILALAVSNWRAFRKSYALWISIGGATRWSEAFFRAEESRASRRSSLTPAEFRPVDVWRPTINPWWIAAEVRDYQADFFEGDFCGEVFLQRAKKIQAALCAGVLNQGEALGADPGGIEGQLALLDEIGDQCDHCGDLAAAELRNFGEGMAFSQELQRFLRGIDCTGVPLLAGAFAFLEAAEHVEDFLAVLIALRFADAGNLAKFGKSFGAYGADLLQRSIVHHDESGAIPFSRGVSSPLLQKLAEFFIDRDGNVPLEGCCFGPASRA